MFQFRLNSIIVNDPDGWDTFSETLELDDTLFGILPKVRSKLTWMGGGYDVIRDVQTTSGYCSTVKIEILQDCSGNFEPLFSGFIFISDCQFTPDECMVECEVEDDSYAARINNNQKLLVNIASTRSKNGVTITPPTAIVTTFHDPVGGNFPNTRQTYDLKDVFEYVIAFVTDGNISFVSTWYDNLPDDEKICVLTGLELRSFGGDVPEIQFDDLMAEIHKKYNVWFTIEDDVFRLEQESYYRNAINSVEFLDVRGIKERFDNAKLYSKIKMGGDNDEDFSAPTTNTPQIRFGTFNKEEFQIQSVCNIDRTLDVRSKWIIETNTIEFVLNTPGDDSYDEDTVLVQYTESTSTTTGIDYLGLVIPILGYNDELRNSEVSARFDVQGDIAFYLGDGNDEFRAERLTTYSAAAVVPGTYTFSPVTGVVYGFEDDTISPNFDTNGNYRNPGDPGAQPVFAYAAPASGYFEFFAKVFYEFNQACDTNIRCDLKLRRFTAAAVFVEERTITGTLQTFLGATYSEELYGGFYMDATDYLFVEIDIIINPEAASGCGAPFADFVLPNDSYFECISASTGGGIFEAKEPGDYFVAEYEFGTCVSREDWEVIRTNIAQSVNFGGSVVKSGWVKSIEHIFSTGETNFQLISNE